MSAIERYLDDLDDELGVRLWRRSRILAEVRDHLEQQAAETQEHEHMSRAEAEQRAIRAFGSPAKVAQGFTPEGPGALNRTIVTASDLSYRIARRPWTLGAIAFWPAGPVALAWVGLDSDSFIWMCACSVGGLLFFTALRELQPAPRSGYVRRWRKLDTVARWQILGALRGDNAPPSQAPAAAFFGEVRQRVRNVRQYSSVVVGLFVLALVCLLLVVAMVASGAHELAVKPGLAFAAFSIAGVASARRDSRFARGRVESELAALEVVEEVAGEALQEGSARLHERFAWAGKSRREAPEYQAGMRLWFELVPENPQACALGLEIRERSVSLWLGPDDFLHEIERCDAAHVHELRIHLDAVVAGRYHALARPAVHRRPLRRTRLYTRLAQAFETDDGPRVSEREYLWEGWEEEWRAAQARLGVDLAELYMEYEFAPYRSS